MAPEADGPLAVGSVFRWQTAGLDIRSTVEQIDAPHRIAWSGPAPGIVAVVVYAPAWCSAARLRFSSQARSDASTATCMASGCAVTASPSQDYAVWTRTSPSWSYT